MVVDASRVEAVYSQYIMYDRVRTHLLIGSKTLTCDESVEQVWSLMKSLILDAAKDGKQANG